MDGKAMHVYKNRVRLLVLIYVSFLLLSESDCV